MTEPAPYDPVALDAGTAAMVAQQIASHITLPAFIAKSCQFDEVTEGGKDEWRRVFRAGLDAYFAAVTPALEEASSL